MNERQLTENGERARFEMWWGTRYPADSFKRTGKSGAYDNVHINNAWLVWKAALAIQWEATS